MSAVTGQPVGIARRPDGVDAPLSFQQLRLWFLDRLERGSRSHNMVVGLRLRGPLRAGDLDRSLRAIVRRHEILRSTVHDGPDGRPVQRVDRSDDVALESVDLAGLPAQQRDAALDSVAKGRAGRPFDLRNGPLLRPVLVRLAEREHVLLLTMHHIVADGASGGILAAELAECYTAYAAGREPELPELVLQYGDFAHWQREHLRGEVLDRHARYWRDRLAGAQTQLDLPTDRARPLTQSHRGETVEFTLPAPVAAGVDRLAREHGVSRFMVGLAAFATVLSRWSGQPDVLLGTPIANRTRSEWSALFGFFANTLVLRTDTSGDPSFADLLARVRDQVSGDFAHQDMPFEKLVEELSPARDLSRHPLFQVLFNWQDEPMGGFVMADLEVEPVPMHSGTAQFDLSLYFHRGSAGEVFAILEYAADLFDRSTAERLAGQLVTLLTAAIADPGRPLSALPLLDEAERRQVLQTWNDTARDRPEGICVHHLVEEQVRRTPDAIALVCGDRSCDFAGLDHAAELLAGRLRALGVGPGALVGVCLPRSIELIVALLAVLKAGGGYLPLDPAHPGGRLGAVLDDAAAALVVTDDPGKFPGRTVLGVAADDPDAAAADPGARAVTADDIAYVLHTSGSTGRAKGVAVAHRAVVDFLLGVREVPGIGSGDTVLAVSTVCFDIALYELFAPLAVGAKVVLAREEETRDGHRLLALMAEHDVTVLDATPVTWHLLLLAGWDGDRPLKAISTGEALTPELAEQLAARSADVWNMYGPTETTVWTAWYRVRGGERPVPIGRPTPNTRAYVLDGAGAPTPVGVPGELYLGGAGVALGYLGAPEVTAAKFVPDPFGPAGSRLYRTGDLVRWTPDGLIEFIGRLDDQVKIRGYRIEPGEVEATLRRHAEVAEVAVVPEGDTPAQRQLVAYVVPRGTPGPSEPDLRRHCAATLPAYLVPARFAAIDGRLPRNSNGKVDRKALGKAGARALSTGAAAAVTPIAGSAALVARVWCEVLGRDRVGPHDNFFDVGGHSLLAVEVQRRLTEQTGREVTLLAVFEHPTVAELAGWVDGADASAPAGPGRAGGIDAGYARRRRNVYAQRRNTRRGSAEKDKG